MHTRVNHPPLQHVGRAGVQSEGGEQLASIGCAGLSRASLKQPSGRVPRIRDAVQPGGDGADPTPTCNPLHTMLFMPSRAAGITAAKIVAVPKPGKAPSGIPGVTLIFDDTSGKLVAMVDASVLTPARTAAGSVLATTLIVPPETEIRTLAIYGGGQQAFWHALLIASVYRSLATVRFIPPPGRGVSATLTGTADRLRAALGGRKIEVTVDSDDAHLAQADVICTCTPSSTPLFRPDAVKPGVHLILVGSCES